MELFKVFKKRYDSIVSKGLNGVTERISPRYLAIFDEDYENLGLCPSSGPPLTPDCYDTGFNIINFLRQWNEIYSQGSPDIDEVISMQLDGIKQMRSLVDSLPACKESTFPSKKRKWYKLWDQEPVENIKIEELYWCTDVVLFRFLRSYKYDVGVAFEMLRKTLAWRRERNPEMIDPQEVEACLVNGMLYRKGYDYTGCPVVYFRPANETGSDPEIQAISLFYTLERATQTVMLSKGNDKVFVILDLKDWSLSKIPTIELVIETVRALSEHYTDVLREILLVDPPMLMDPLMHMIKAVLDQSTSKKILTKHRGPSLETYLKERIPSSFLETSLGGDEDSIYEHSVYWGFEQSQYLEFQRKRNKWIEDNDTSLESKSNETEL